MSSLPVPCVPSSSGTPTAAETPGGGAALDARHGVHVLLEPHVATLLDCAGSPNCARLPTTRGY